MSLLDTISKTLSTGVDRARFEADKFQRTSRISGEISNVKSQVDTNMRQLGERAFELHRQGKLNAPEVASLTQVITQLQAQQADKERELGEAQNDTFDLWLARQPQPQPSTPDQNADMYDQTSYTPPMSTPSALSTINNGSPVETSSGTATSVPPFAGATGAQQAVDAAPYACSNCGFALPANAIFCPNCGTRVAQA
jgi:lipopolysaccharide biosynthesis regulator YciM